MALGLALLLPWWTGCARPARAFEPVAAIPLRLTFGPETLRTGVKRMGINLGGQTYYDSGQMLRNLTFRNPGFEGGTWQSILHCKAATATSCTDANPYTVWPAGFLDGARLEVLSGAAAGAAGMVRHSTAAGAGSGVTFALDKPVAGLAAGDFVLVRLDQPGHADAGWWIEAKSGATTATELHDLSPHTPGRQALRIDACAPGASSSVHSYFDSMEGHSFVHLHGHYTLTFRARAVAGAPHLAVSLTRLDTHQGLHSFVTREPALSQAWQDVRFDFDAEDLPAASGTLDLAFAFTGGTALLDDASLTEAAAPGNPTAFRNAVVDTLRTLRPGILRYMDSGTDFGSSLDNMLAVPDARLRAGASTQQTVQEDIPLGLVEFLTLCETVGAEPWYSMPAGTSPEDAARLAEFLAAPASAPMGQVRARLGHPSPWTASFPTIHLELGNEQWNTGSFPGASLNDPTVYAHRADRVFRAIRQALGYTPAAFDLVLGTWSALPWWTQQELAASQVHDSVAIAPYLFNTLEDVASDERIFGPMLAQPQMQDSDAAGIVQRQAAAARTATHPARLAVYEVNLGTTATHNPAVTQHDVGRIVPSLGAGLAVATHMLLMLRDAGVTDDCLFALPEFRNDFSVPAGKLQVPLWGAVVDMGGATGRRRPQALALEAINQAILPTLLATHIEGTRPGWQQLKSTNDSIELTHAEGLQTFAFADGHRRSLILLNLMRTEPISLTLPQPAASTAVERSVLSADRIDATNEDAEEVRLTHSLIRANAAGLSLHLPPHSLTTLRWSQP